MLRTAVVMALGLGALIGGPLAPAAQAETLCQVRLENHPVAARRHFESYPVRDDGACRAAGAHRRLARRQPPVPAHL